MTDFTCQWLKECLATSKYVKIGVPAVAQWLMNLTRNHEDVGSVPGLAQWGKKSGLAVSCGVARRCSSDPTLLWLWRKPAAVALIRPPAWELPYAWVQPLKKKYAQTS